MRLLEFFSPTFKRLAGVLLTGFSAVALFRWAIASIHSDNPWYSAPFLWMGTLLTLLLGLVFLVSSSPKVQNPAAPITIRKKIILFYFFCSLGVSILMVITQATLMAKRLPSPQSYVPIIILLAVINVVIIHIRYTQKVHYGYKSLTALHTLFIVGNVLVPLMIITLFNELVQQIQTLESGSAIIHAESNFLKFKELKLDEKRTLSWTQNWDRKESFRTDYDVLLPVITNPRDTLYNVWIEMEFSEKYDNKLPEDSLHRLAKAFRERCYQRMVHFNQDSVAFFDVTFTDGEKVLVINQYPIVKGAIFLRPQYGTLTSYEATLMIPMAALWLIITAGFWFIASDQRGMSDVI